MKNTVRHFCLFYFALTMVGFLASCADKAEDPIDTNLGEADLIGTWNPTSNAVFKVIFYTREGEYYDSISTPYEDVCFNFLPANQVETPWGTTDTYSLHDGMITFNIMNMIKRDYQVLQFTASRLVLERLDTAEYYATNDAGTGTDTVVGYETEHWDLIKL